MRRFLMAGLLCLLAASPLAAQELMIGTQADPTLDPHFLYVGTNVQIWRHIYGTLTMPDAAGKIVPGIAESFTAIDDRTWEFKLRPGIVFRDGTPLTADNVVFSLNRIPHVPANPNPYTPKLESVVSVEAIDAHTVRIHTSVTNPYVPDNMAFAGIISRAAVEGKSTGDFASLKAVMEYGPYRVVSFTPGDKIVLERNPTFWGDKPYWQKVTFRFIAKDAPRVAALLAGDVDLIDFVPPADRLRLKQNPAFATYQGITSRIYVLLINFRPDPVPSITDAAGNQLPKNPLLDLRVRRALSKAINRPALADNIMDGAAVPVSQMFIPGMEGYDPTITPERYDPDGARALLAEAGYPSGFSMTITCSNNRYANDDRICQALGQMFTRVGVRTKVDTFPFAIAATRMRDADGKPPETALGLIGLRTVGRQSLAPPLMIHSSDPKVGRGQYNFMHYANPELDRLIDAGLTTLDATQRDERLRIANRRSVEDLPIFPMYAERVTTATKANLDFTVDANEETLAWRVAPRK